MSEQHNTFRCLLYRSHINITLVGLKACSRASARAKIEIMRAEVHVHPLVRVWAQDLVQEGNKLGLLERDCTGQATSSVWDRDNDGTNARIEKMIHDSPISLCLTYQLKDGLF